MTVPLTSTVESTLSPHLDSDACDYILSLLSEDPDDDDSREAVRALISSSIADDDGDALCDEFFRLLDLNSGGGGGGNSSGNNDDDDDHGSVPRKLDNAITMKDKDETTFASGLIADSDPAMDASGNTAPSKIASFYANMIDISANDAMSERMRRKMRQKELREEMERKERQRAIEDAMTMLEDDGGGGEGGGDGGEDAAKDNAADVHFRNLDLPNLRGGGPDLLQNASLILAKGRRYGLMGRNGCGKTTLMTFIANRQMKNGGVPKNMSMLLVRQEIMGNEWTSVETVLKSDVRREGVKKFITWCETELERLENGGAVEEITPPAQDPTNGGGGGISSKEKPEKKSGGKAKQKLRDRKKAKMQGAAKAKVLSAKTTSSSKEKEKETVEGKKTRVASMLSKAYQRLAAIEEEEGGDPEPRARKVLSGLGFSTEMQDKATKELSGGWRMRVSLACALFASPSLLLLDEPTNHLDLEAVLWLERYLTTKFKGTLVVVSHDRHFLNEVVTDVVHFHRNQVTTYRGDISNFEQVVEDNKQRQIRLREVQEAKRAHLQKYIDLHAQAGENGVKAARQRKSKMKKLDKLGVMAQEGKKWKASYDDNAEEVEEYVEEEEVELNFPDPGRFDGHMVRLEQTSFGYSPDKLLLDGVDLSVDAKSRVALLGRNGCGKSTLIKLIVGALKPLKGKAVIDARAKIEYLAQHQLEQLDPDGTPLLTMVERYPGDRSNSHIGELRRYLANFGLGGEILPNQKVHTMSGGQKCRLCLACAMYRRPHLLILDEPTNHLDMETTEALIDAINKFEGGVLLVSHDQHLLTSACKELYVVEKGNVEKLGQGLTNEEAFESYKKAVVKGRR